MTQESTIELVVYCSKFSSHHIKSEHVLCWGGIMGRDSFLLQYRNPKDQKTCFCAWRSHFNPQVTIYDDRAIQSTINEPIFSLLTDFPCLSPKVKSSHKHATVIGLASQTIILMSPQAIKGCFSDRLYSVPLLVQSHCCQLSIFANNWNIESQLTYTWVLLHTCFFNQAVKCLFLNVP